MLVVGPLRRPALLAIAVLLPFLMMTFVPEKSRYVIDTSILVLTYVMLGWGLNIVVGLAGLLDLATSPSTRWVPILRPACAIFRLVVLALPAGRRHPRRLVGHDARLPVLRLRGDYLAIVTLAFGENSPRRAAQLDRLHRRSERHLETFPGRASSAPVRARPGGFAATFGLPFSPIHRIVFLYYLILALALLTAFDHGAIAKIAGRTGLGGGCARMRSHCRSLGINKTLTKLSAFATGAMFRGFAGSFFATRRASSRRNPSPSWIRRRSSRSSCSAASAADRRRDRLDHHDRRFEAFRGLDNNACCVFGLAMVLIMIWRPRGMVSVRKPTVALGKAKAIDASLVGGGARLMRWENDPVLTVETSPCGSAA